MSPKAGLFRCLLLLHLLREVLAELGDFGIDHGHELGSDSLSCH